MRHSILVVEPEGQESPELFTLLEADGYQAVAAATIKQALKALNERQWCMVMIALDLPPLERAELLGAIHGKAYPCTIAFIGSPDSEDGVRVAKSTDCQVFGRPFDSKKLGLLLCQAARLAEEFALEELAHRDLDESGEAPLLPQASAGLIPEEADNLFRQVQKEVDAIAGRCHVTTTALSALKQRYREVVEDNELLANRPVGNLHEAGLAGFIVPFPQPAIITRANVLIVGVSDAFAKLLDVEPTALVGHSVKDTLSPSLGALVVNARKSFNTICEVDVSGTGNPVEYTAWGYPFEAGDETYRFIALRRWEQEAAD